MPDLSFAAYLSGPRFGALVYNAAHSYLAPMAMMTSGFATASPLVLSIAMIWLAHIGFDRALGYGLKYAAGFNFTHLGRIGKHRIDRSAQGRKRFPASAVEAGVVPSSSWPGLTRLDPAIHVLLISGARKDVECPAQGRA